jgi:hypothetical protein
MTTRTDDGAPFDHGRKGVASPLSVLATATSVRGNDRQPGVNVGGAAGGARP